MTLLSIDQHPALSPLVIQALKDKQIFTVLDLIKADSNQIIKITRLTFKEVLELRKDLLKKYSATPLNGYNYYKNIMRNSAIISTGIESLDTLLDGGFLTGNIYEICGLPASGKTQFCYTVTKNIVKNLKQNVYYLDARFNFLGAKMRSILEDLDGAEITKCMERVLVKRIQTIFDLINSLYSIKTELENKLNCRLIIIDSLPNLVLEFQKFYSVLTHLINIMHYIACQYHIVFVVVNLQTTWKKGDYRDQEKSIEIITCGGKMWSSTPNTRLKIEKNGDECEMSIISSDLSNRLNDKVKLCITGKGIVSKN